MSLNRKPHPRDAQGEGGLIRSIVPLPPHGTRTEAIASQLIRLIIDGHWKPGERLPTEFELAGRFQAGRGAVREALKALAVVGLVTVQRGKGTYIAPRDGFLVRPILLGLGPTADLPSLIEARRLIEVELAGLATERATREEIKTIKSNLERMDSCIDSGDVEGFLQADASFHFSIAEAARNPLLGQCVTLIRNAMQQVVSLVVTGPDSARRAQPFHKQIFKAIQSRRPATARAAMTRHLSDAGKLWLTTNERAKRNKRGVF